MGVSYNKLWHILIDKNMRKKDLQEAAGLTPHIMLVLRKNRHITTTTIYKICKALNCSANDFLEFVEMES